MIKIKVFTLKRRKLCKSLLAGRDLTRVKIFLLPAKKNFVKSSIPYSNYSFSNGGRSSEIRM